MESTPPLPPAPLLSVVVPFYGVEEYIGACLESLRTQLLDDIEVVLVDDGSPDGSAAVAADFVDRDPRFRLLTQANAGLGPARNTGASAARGTYLMFVDSDDLVTPRGLWSMVETLERTGSDFAAGNAWRFTDERGTYQSWTHERPFASTQLATTLAERPDLIGDRMAWNKVYRRDFWERERFAFPAIRYEDYPVTLRAYLRAETVDVVSDHIYLWRDRESGTSITQQRASLANAQDRYASAVMALEELEASPTTEDVHRRVRTYLAWVDVPSLATTAVLTEGEAQVTAWHLATDLADRTRTRGLADAPRSVRLINESLWRGDLKTAGAVARWRSGGGLFNLGADTAKVAHPRKVAALARMAVSAKAPQHLLRPRRLRSNLGSARWDGGALTLELETTLRTDFARRVAVTAWAEQGGRRRSLPSPEVRIAPPGLHTVVHIHDVDVATLLHSPLHVGLSLQLPGKALRWQGQVRADSSALPAPHRMEGADVLITGEELTVTARPVGDHTSASVSPGPQPGTVTVTLSDERPVALLRLRRPAPTVSLDIPVSGHRSVLDVASALADDVSDDPVRSRYERLLVAVTEAGEEIDVLVTSEPATVVIGDQQASLTRNTSGMLALSVAPAG